MRLFYRSRFAQLGCFIPHGSQIAVSNIATTAGEMVAIPAFFSDAKAPFAARQKTE